MQKTLKKLLMHCKLTYYSWTPVWSSFSEPSQNCSWHLLKKSMQFGGGDLFWGDAVWRWLLYAIHCMCCLPEQGLNGGCPDDWSGLDLLVKIIFGDLDFFLFEDIDELASLENFRQLVGHVDRAVHVFVGEQEHVVGSEELADGAIVSFFELICTLISRI